MIEEITKLVRDQKQEPHDSLFNQDATKGWNLACDWIAKCIENKYKVRGGAVKKTNNPK